MMTNTITLTPAEFSVARRVYANLLTNVPLPPLSALVNTIALPVERTIGVDVLIAALLRFDHVDPAATETEMATAAALAGRISAHYGGNN